MSLRGYIKKGKPATWTMVHPKVQEAPKLKRVRSVSRRLAPLKAIYRRRAEAFVAAAVGRGERCQVVALVPELRNGRKYGHPISDRLNEVHHKRGRLGELLLDERFWLAVSKQGHRYLHEHPDWARQNGFMSPKGLWNKPHRAGMCMGCGCDVHPSCEWCGECLCEQDGL